MAERFFQARKQQVANVHAHTSMLNAGALIIRIGFWGPLYCTYNKTNFVLPVALLRIQTDSLS